MVLSGLAFDQHVIHVYLHVSADMILIDLIYQALIGRACILEPKEHDPIIIKPMISNKGSILLIL